MRKSPLEIVNERFKDKDGLVKAVRELATDQLWVERLGDKGLKRVPNKKLLHLHDVLGTVKAKFGSRSSMIDALLGLQGRSNDADFRSKLETYSTPKLWELYRAASKRARSK
ncbi:MAG: hypothetical protein MJD61_05880 [Proteobacteria bacterium]|nr:hypothetical protein [Pseudomonadota bacterium]